MASGRGVWPLCGLRSAGRSGYGLEADLVAALDAAHHPGHLLPREAAPAVAARVVIAFPVPGAPRQAARTGAVRHIPVAAACGPVAPAPGGSAPAPGTGGAVLGMCLAVATAPAANRFTVRHRAGRR